ncbi:tetratricopeptide repeat protein [Flavobacteriaceae bacterium]|nr:tetratricopeptide repeat protein [Flavobacteriaceae bacterium]MDB9712944.1 tetratricopeptide repeat protein [Flavobacteriaceae bacterium]MDC1491835.1 tetratricopeptide repeat protein [Flavobacteriaceae bacterium]
MRNQKIIFLIFSLIVFNSFGQKKELKAAEKALKTKNFVSAKENIVAVEVYDLSNIDLKTKIKYHYIKGLAYYEDGDSNLANTYLALDNFKKVISLEENSTYKTYSDKVKPLKTTMLNKFVQKATTALESKDYKTSYMNLESAFRVSTRDTLYLYNAALLATETKDFDKAMNFYKELEDLGFTGVTTNYYATDILSDEEQSFTSESNRDLFVKAGSHKEPRNEITESVELSVFRSMAAIYRDFDDSIKALEYIAKAKKISELDINVILLEANIRWELGEVENYKELISKALEIDPTNADLLYNLGIVSVKNNDPESAMLYYERAIAVNPKYTNAYLQIGNLILEQQDPIIKQMDGLGMSTADYNKYDQLSIELENIQRKASSYFESVIDFEPNNNEAVKTLRSIYSALGDDENYKLMKEKLEKIEN